MLIHIYQLRNIILQKVAILTALHVVLKLQRAHMNQGLIKYVMPFHSIIPVNLNCMIADTKHLCVDQFNTSLCDPPHRPTQDEAETLNKFQYSPASL